MSKQGHYTFMSKDDAERAAEIFRGRVIPDYHHSVYPMYHVWFEYEDKDNIDFIERLLFDNINLRKQLKDDKEKIALEDESDNLTKQLRESQECVRRITQRNNELRAVKIRDIERDIQDAEAKLERLNRIHDDFDKVDSIAIPWEDN